MHIATHVAALVEEIQEDGAGIAERMDAATQMLVEAAHERASCAQRLDALVAAVRGRSEYGDVAISRADTLINEANRLLGRGGENAPTLRHELVPQPEATPA